MRRRVQTTTIERRSPWHKKSRSKNRAVPPRRAIEIRSPRCVQKWIAYSTAFSGEACSVGRPCSVGLRRPGIDEKDIEILVRDGVLTLKGQKKSERDEKKENYHLVERSYGSFERSFRLPDSIDEAQIKADFNKGVLRIVVPKRAEAVKSEKKIPIGKG